MNKVEESDVVKRCSQAIGIANKSWHEVYGQTMLVDKSVTDAMSACHVSNNFGQTKWPSKSLNIRFECKSLSNITISRGNWADIVQTAYNYANAMQDFAAKDYLHTLCVEWGPDEKGIPQWMRDVIMFTVETPLGLCFGNLPSECGENEIREGMTTFVDYKQNRQDILNDKLLDTVLMALKVINYSSIPYFAPTKINLWDKKALKSAKKKYKIKTSKSLYRVVYLPKKIREYQEKKGHKKTGPLKNGRVGHIRTLHSDYFVNKQGDDVFIPPIPDSQGRYPKIIYMVKKPKAA